jgi:hypothetical protein
MNFLVILLYQVYSILSHLLCFLSLRARPTSGASGTSALSSTSPDSIYFRSSSHNGHGKDLETVSAQAHSGWNREISAAGGSLDEEEVEKFGAQSGSWWDLNGEFCLLHRMNPVRVL